VAATAPFCNVTVVQPPPGPTSPRGFRTLSHNASLQDVINIFNYNFSPQMMVDNFLRNLRADLNNVQGNIRTAVRQEIGQVHMVQTAIVRQKIKVVNPQDPEQWVIDDRIKAMTMTDNKTGANWIWQDANAGAGVQAGTEETGTFDIG